MKTIKNRFARIALLDFITDKKPADYIPTWSSWVARTGSSRTLC